MNIRNLTFTCLALPLFACGGSGNLSFTTYGEDFIEVGIPAASEAEPEGVVDGWAIRYDSFYVVLADITVGEDEVEATRDAAARVFDMTAAGPHAVTSFSDLPSGTYDAVGASLRPDPAPVAGNVDAAAVGLMKDGGWSVYATGEAEKAGVKKTFAWGFDLSTKYVDCEDADEKAGVVVPNGGAITAQLTIHGDHLFYDDLQADDAVMRFDAIAAADADDDGEVTLAELAAVDLTSLPADQYGTGGDGRVVSLADFVRDQTRTLLHFQGEGHCHSSVE